MTPCWVLFLMARVLWEPLPDPALLFLVIIWIIPNPVGPPKLFDLLFSLSSFRCGPLFSPKLENPHLYISDALPVQLPSFHNSFVSLQVTLVSPNSCLTLLDSEKMLGCLDSPLRRRGLETASWQWSETTIGFAPLVSLFSRITASLF